MQFFNEQQNRAYFRQKNLPKKDKQDLILEKMLEPKEPDYTSKRMSKFLDEIKGEKGESGYTPRKGIDYLLEEEIDEYLQRITPVKGIHYFDGEKGEPGADSYVPGPMGLPGEPGKDAVVDEKKIVKAILKLLPEVMPSREHSTQDIVKQVTKEVIEFQIEEDRKNKRKLGPLLGGGTWVGNSYTAGSGISIVGGVITATGGGGGGYTVETPTGVVDGNNTSFTVTVAPVYIVVDNATLFPNFGYTIVGLNITTDTPPQNFIRSFHV